MYLRPPRPKMSVKGTRLTASTLLLLASLLLAVSMGVSWWGASVSGGGNATVIGFEPGSDYSAQSHTNSSSQHTYISSGLVHVGELYEAVLGVGLLAMVAGFGGVLLSFGGTFTAFKSRKFLMISLLLTIISLVGAALLPGLVALGQPGAFNADSTSGFGGSGCGNSPNPCTAFWGSVSAGGSTISWGADVGWYLAIAAAVLLLVAFIQLWSTRKMPYTRDEVAAVSPYAMSAPAPPAGSPAPPMAGAPAGGTPVAPPPSASSYCPKCGNPMTYVAQYSRWYCMTERTYL